MVTANASKIAPCNGTPTMRKKRVDPQLVRNKKAIKGLCEEMGLRYHHHDSFAKPRYDADEILARAVVVVYPGQYDPWCLAIDEDGTVRLPWENIEKMARRLQNNLIPVPRGMTSNPKHYRRLHERIETCQ